MFTDHGIAAALQRLENAELRLVETNHRIANELASAIAALRIAQVAGDRTRADCVDAAVSRLESCAQVHRLMSTAGGGDASLAETLEALCTHVARSRLDERGISLTLLAHDVDHVRLPPTEAQRVGAIVCELVTNAIKHSPGDGQRAIEVRAHRVGTELRLVVASRRAGSEPKRRRRDTDGAGFGRPILAELVRRIGGTIITDIAGEFHRVEIRLPDLVAPVAKTTRRLLP